MVSNNYFSFPTAQYEGDCFICLDPLKGKDAVAHENGGNHHPLCRSCAKETAEKIAYLRNKCSYCKIEVNDSSLFTWKDKSIQIGKDMLNQAIFWLFIQTLWIDGFQTTFNKITFGLSVEVVGGATGSLIADHGIKTIVVTNVVMGALATIASMAMEGTVLLDAARFSIGSMLAGVVVGKVGPVKTVFGLCMGLAGRAVTRNFPVTLGLGAIGGAVGGLIQRKFNILT